MGSRVTSRSAGSAARAGAALVLLAVVGGHSAAAAETPPVPAVRPVVADGCAEYVEAAEAYPFERCDEGWPVEAIQLQLVANSYTVTVDGLYGPKTERAVKEFQADVGRTVDGVVGPRTWTALVEIGGFGGFDSDDSGLIDPWEVWAVNPACEAPNDSVEPAGDSLELDVVMLVDATVYFDDDGTLLLADGSFTGFQFVEAWDVGSEHQGVIVERRQGELAVLLLTPDDTVADAAPLCFVDVSAGDCSDADGVADPRLVVVVDPAAADDAAADDAANDQAAAEEQLATTYVVDPELGIFVDDEATPSCPQ